MGERRQVQAARCSAQAWLICVDCLDDVYSIRWEGEAVQMTPHTRGSFPEPHWEVPCLRDNAGQVAEVHIATGQPTPGMRSRRLALAGASPAAGARLDAQGQLRQSHGDLMLTIPEKCGGRNDSAGSYRAPKCLCCPKNSCRVAYSVLTTTPYY